MNHDQLQSALFKRFSQAFETMEGNPTMRAYEACGLLALFMRELDISTFDVAMSTAVPGIKITPTVQFDIPTVIVRDERLEASIAQLQKSVRHLGFVIGTEPGMARLSMAYLPYVKKAANAAKLEVPFWKTGWFQATVVITVATAAAHLLAKSSNT